MCLHHHPYFQDLWQTQQEGHPAAALHMAPPSTPTSRLAVVFMIAVICQFALPAASAVEMSNRHLLTAKPNNLAPGPGMIQLPQDTTHVLPPMAEPTADVTEATQPKANNVAPGFISSSHRALRHIFDGFEIKGRYVLNGAFFVSLGTVFES